MAKMIDSVSVELDPGLRAILDSFSARLKAQDALLLALADEATAPSAAGLARAIQAAREFRQYLNS